MRTVGASVLLILALSSPVMALPLEAQYVQRGYDLLVRCGSILPTSDYSKALRQAIALISQGKSVDETSRLTGVNARVLEKLLRLGTPFPAVDPNSVVQAALPPAPVPKKKPPQKLEAAPASPGHVEGYGMGNFHLNRFEKLKKFKVKTTIVENFLDERSQQAAAPSGTTLTPSQRALMDLQGRSKKAQGVAVSP
jgi:hypothetical protein